MIMKKLFKYFFPCFAFAFAVVSCNDTMDDKASIDAQYENTFATPTVTIQATATAFNIINATATIDDVNNVAELGVQIAGKEDFSDAGTAVSETVVPSYTVDAPGLTELTKYYVRAYALGKNGKTVYSDALVVTTPEAPLIPLAGTYTTNEFYIKNGTIMSSGDSYKVTIAFEEGSEEIVNITNIWDAETTVQGIYDKETQTVTIPNDQLIYTDATYGPMTLQGITDDLSNFAPSTILTFNPRGGTIKSSFWACLITTGAYAGYTYNNESFLEMTHD